MAILGWFGIQLPADHWLGFLAAALVHIALLITVVAVGALVFIWMERKISGRIQDRLGPTRVGRQVRLAADAGRRHEAAHQGRHHARRRPIRCCSSWPPTSASRPASPPIWPCRSPTAGWASDINVAVFFILAVLGLEVFGVILAGYASGSKWSLFGGMREAAQVVSYEVPLGLCVVVPVMLCGTMDLVTIGNMQAGWFTNWFIFHDPFTFVIFWVYFTCADGQRESGSVRSGRGGKRTGGRFPDRVFRPALEHLLHGRVRLDVRRQRPGGDPVLRRLERTDPDLPVLGLPADAKRNGD